MTIVMDVRSCMKATLLAIIVLSVLTWLSHMYSCIKTFLESLPSIVSAAIAPKCLFIFSNIIVVFLVSESKLSRRRSKLLKTNNNASARDLNEEILQDSQKLEEVLLAEVLLPTIIGDNKPEQENHMVTVEEVKKEASLGNEDVQMDHCEEEVDQLVVQHVDAVEGEAEETRQHELAVPEEEGGEHELAAMEEEVSGHVEELEMDLPPADDLHRRVEDFIARFNLDRQLEARMLVCCN